MGARSIFPDSNTIPVSQLKERIERDMAKLKAAVEKAIDETVLDSVGIIWQRVPFAFGELHGSIRADRLAGFSDTSAARAVVADAPHAVAVEVGSMPHMPPVAALIPWAELRGAADPERTAWAIALKIAREGTRPRWYMRGSLPAIRRQLHANVREYIWRAGIG